MRLYMEESKLSFRILLCPKVAVLLGLLLILLVERGVLLLGILFRLESGRVKTTGLFFII